MPGDGTEERKAVARGWEGGRRNRVSLWQDGTILEMQLTAI